MPTRTPRAVTLEIMVFDMKALLASICSMGVIGFTLPSSCTMRAKPGHDATANRGSSRSSSSISNSGGLGNSKMCGSIHEINF